MLSERRLNHLKENSIDDWVLFFHAMYREANRDRLPAILWLETIDEATKLTEEARKNRPCQVLKRAVRIFGWLCGFVGKYTIEAPSNEADPIGNRLRQSRSTDRGQGESLGKWIWEKFPGLCPVCAGERCLCPSYRKLAEDRYSFDMDAAHQKLASPHISQSQKEFLQRQVQEQKHYLAMRKVWRDKLSQARKDTGELKFFLNKPLDRQIDMFADIYGGTHFDMDLLQITCKLLEEIGEASREIVALSELWEIRNRLKVGSLSARNRQGLEKSLEMLLSKDRDSLPREFVAEVRAKIKEDLAEALEYFCEESAESLKGELADVFSWLTAVLYKVATDLCEYREEQELYQLSDIVRKHYVIGSETLCCPECHEAACDRLCLWINICKTILEDKKKGYQRENLGVAVPGKDRPLARVAAGFQHPVSETREQ